MAAPIEKQRLVLPLALVLPFCGVLFLEFGTTTAESLKVTALNLPFVDERSIMLTTDTS